MMQAAVDPAGQSSVDVGSMDYDSIMKLGYPFFSVDRLSATAKSTKLRREVERSCVEAGVPIVIEGWHKHPEWKPELYTFSFLQEHFGASTHPGSTIPDAIQDTWDEDENERHQNEINLESLTYKQGQEQEQEQELEEEQEQEQEPEPKPESEQEYGRNRERKNERKRERKHKVKSEHREEHVPEQQPPQDSYTLPSPRSPTKTPQPRPEDPFFYAKDVSCPTPWKSHMENIIPNWLSYMNDNDLLANVKGDKAAENMMIYVGSEGTWTPAHFDQCGAIGHNIMAWAEDDSRSIWFMVSAKDKKKAEEFWRSLKQPLEYEGYFASVEELRKAEFPIFVIEQKLGDFVVVPSESYHQVVNMGKATIKVSWNRLTAHCLKAAVNNVLPRYREICRPESYRIKLTIHDTLKTWTDLLLKNKDLPQPVGYFCESFKTILELFKGIVEDDWVDRDVLFKGKKNEWFPEPDVFTDVSPARCDFCQADLWNRQFHCPDCTEEESAYDICTYCFAQGRGCEHRAKPLEIVESCSMKSCRELVSRAIEAWNESEKLKEWEEYDQMSDPWKNEIVPSKVKGASNATLAYMRISMLRSKKSERPLPSVQNKTHPFPNRMGRLQILEPVLWFSRPDDHSKNRGGVSDDMNQSFNRLYVFKNEEDDAEEEEYSRHRTRNNDKRSAEEVRTSGHQLKRIKRADPSTLYFEPDRVKQGTLSDSLDIADTEMFQLMHDLGLGRALRRMEAIQCDDGKYYSDVFQIEAKMQTMGSRYHPALDGLRLDILEKFALRRAGCDGNDPIRDNGEGPWKAQEPQEKDLEDKESEDEEPEVKESEDEESEDKNPIESCSSSLSLEENE
ncbi:hypothetical protein BGZ92_001237 [Podila epicladia]|nr:hypothetical protein BGZ92_001237 [Podila epicladia]